MINILYFTGNIEFLSSIVKKMIEGSRKVDRKKREKEKKVTQTERQTDR